MEENQKLEHFVKDKTFCVKCGSKIPFDEVGHNCELIECPRCKKEKSSVK